MSSRSERVGGFTRGSGKRGSGGRFSSHYSGRSANLDSQNSRRDYDGDNHSRFRSHSSRGGYHNVSPDRRHSERGMNYHSHYSGKTSSGVRVPGGSGELLPPEFTAFLHSSFNYLLIRYIHCFLFIFS